MDKFKQELTTPNATINVAQGSLNSDSSKTSASYTNGEHFYCGRGRQPHGKGCGRQYFSTGNRPTCQSCKKYGQFVLECWHRFDENFEPTQPKSQTQASTSNNSNSNQSYKVSASIAPQVTTYLAHHNTFDIPQGLESHAWFVDSSASHHIISSLMNIQNVQACVGPNRVVIGNGLGLEVEIVGHSKFSSILASNSILNLTNLLYVPIITINLILVSKFEKDNNVYFEFHSNNFFVKS